ncbi:DNA-directed RNA polymerase subunit delta [Cohnella sp. CFH 77786]|uniref:DNA-directed RNA polymerase subunit delta n=1 Tax=Cohnella sp. CFH 77786 TaxID=2662265 RepID=UPI00351D9A32
MSAEYVLKLDSEKIREMPMVDLAFEVLKAANTPFYYRDLMNEIAKLRGFSEEQINEVIAQLYTEINIDGRFACVGSNVWGLKRWYPVERDTDGVTGGGKRPRIINDDDDDDEDLYGEEDEETFATDEENFDLFDEDREEIFDEGEESAEVDEEVVLDDEDAGLDDEDLAGEKDEDDDADEELDEIDEDDELGDDEDEGR